MRIHNKSRLTPFQNMYLYPVCNTTRKCLDFREIQCWWCERSSLSEETNLGQSHWGRNWTTSHLPPKKTGRFEKIVRSSNSRCPCAREQYFTFRIRENTCSRFPPIHILNTTIIIFKFLKYCLRRAGISRPNSRNLSYGSDHRSSSVRVCATPWDCLQRKTRLWPSQIRNDLRSPRSFYENKYAWTGSINV